MFKCMSPVLLLVALGVMVGLRCVLAQALRAGLGWGQQQFQLLLQESPASGDGAAAAAAGESEDVCLEELRYRWMLHKSKLKDVGDLRSRRRAMVGYGVMLAFGHTVAVLRNSAGCLAWSWGAG